MDIGAHASLDDGARDNGEQHMVEFFRFGGRGGGVGLKSRAEEMQMQRRVRLVRYAEALNAERYPQIQRLISLSGNDAVAADTNKAIAPQPVKHELTDVHLRAALKDA